jgi:iron-sulfur cluster assembly protein
MNVVLIAVGCVLMALGLVMAANRSGYLYFVVGPRSVLLVAGVVALLAFWIHGAVPRQGFALGEPLARTGVNARRPVKPPGPMLYIRDRPGGGRPTEIRTMASRLLRRQVMTLTDAAAARVRELTEAAGKPVAGLRVGVKNGGCAGMSYTMELAEAANPTDEIIEDKGVKVLIDPKAVLFLLGSQMDFKVDRLSATFAFSNPNETSACGCGESVAITPASPEALHAPA